MPMYSACDPLTRGLPHSDIHGSKPARGSPWLFAACHVLHRLLVPRHPPNALLSLKTLTPGHSIRGSTMHRNHPQKTVFSLRSSVLRKQVNKPLSSHPSLSDDYRLMPVQDHLDSVPPG